MKKERSDAQKMGFYKRELRSLWRRSPMYWEAYRNARTKAGVLKCGKCGEEGNAKLFEMDHIEPVVSPERGDEGIQLWVYRLNCHSDGLQALCEVCHNAKTTGENKRRHKNGTGAYSPEALARKSGPVVAVNLITGEAKLFLSQAEAATKLRVDAGNLSKVVQGDRNSLNGYTFQGLGLTTIQKSGSGTLNVDTNVGKGVN